MPTWYVKVSDKLDHLVEKAIKDGVFTNKSELIRQAVREMLEKLGYKIDGGAQNEGE